VLKASLQSNLQATTLRCAYFDQGAAAGCAYSLQATDLGHRRTPFRFHSCVRSSQGCWRL